MGKLENLKNSTWINSTPIIETVKEAFQRDFDSGKADHNFYMITWWGDEPAGFTRFEFTGNGYEIFLMEERRESSMILRPDELVLVFQQF